MRQASGIVGTMPYRPYRSVLWAHISQAFQLGYLIAIYVELRLKAAIVVRRELPPLVFIDLFIYGLPTQRMMMSYVID